MNRCECGHSDTFHENDTGPCEECDCSSFERDLDWDPTPEPEGFDGYNEQ